MNLLVQYVIYLKLSSSIPYVVHISVAHASKQVALLFILQLFILQLLILRNLLRLASKTVRETYSVESTLRYFLCTVDFRH